MKRRLTIIPGRFHTYFKASKLSIKAAGNAGHELILDECGYCIHNVFKTNRNTAYISVKELVNFLKDLKEEFEFDSIRIDGHYELSGEELYKLVINH